MASPPVVICPTEFEASLIRRIVRDRATVVVSGIGPARMGETLARLPSGTPAVVVAGVAGGLKPTAVAPRVRTVQSATLDPAPPNWAMPWSPGVTDAALLGIDEPAWSAAEKAGLAAKTGADMIDCETHVLRVWAERTGTAWGVVRGISDGPTDSVPPVLGAWIDAHGKPRIGRIALDLVRSPSLIPKVRAIRDRSTAAMEAVAQGIDRLMDMIGAAAPDAPHHPAPRIGPMPIDPAARSVLVFGGTFDPPHRAHVELSVHAMRTVACDAMAVIPAARSPHKSSGPTTSAEDRVAMLELAFRGHPGVSICTAELDRAVASPDRPSYTVDTIAEMHKALGHEVTIRLLIGSDQAATFHNWRAPGRILAMATPAVVLRPPLETIEAFSEALRIMCTGAEVDQWVDRIVPAPISPISATAIRAGEMPLADAMPPAVARYAEIRGLYRSPR